MTTTDTQNRPLHSLRLSVTDRCNLRCQYCMPETDYVWLKRAALLNFEEIDRLINIFSRAGIERVRITGGEPLLRRDLQALIQLISAKDKIKDLALTTNGVLLASQAKTLKTAGLHRVTVSLDTLRPDRFLSLTKGDFHHQVVNGIDAAAATFGGLKIDTVVIRNVNQDELVQMIEFGKKRNAEVRFIEYMDVGGATKWSMSSVVPRTEILQILSKHYDQILPISDTTSAPADRFALSDGTSFGIISSTTVPFCHSCDRSRITADGIWYLCLYATQGEDLRQSLRSGLSDNEILNQIKSSWKNRTDEGAKDRLKEERREAFVSLKLLRQDSHLEMHTRGG